MGERKIRPLQDIQVDPTRVQWAPVWLTLTPRPVTHSWGIMCEAAWDPVRARESRWDTNKKRTVFGTPPPPPTTPEAFNWSSDRPIENSTHWFPRRVCGDFHYVTQNPRSSFTAPSDDRRQKSCFFKIPLTCCSEARLLTEPWNDPWSTAC